VGVGRVVGAGERRQRQMCIRERYGARYSCDKEARVQACHAVQKPDALVVVAAASFCLLAKPPCICHLASLVVTFVVD
jgi:hypothetical protein